MLTIPDSIKTLYKSDARPDIRKNFRVTFPNGELADITNDQIVSESVKFTESLMSQQNFRFGLAEAPQISFETVGVANMMGMTIDCFSEIETSTLTAAELAEIEAGDYDGTLVDEEDSDIGFGYYRIPLGEFIVQSCPRSHGAMTHRQVQAMGRTITNTSMDAFTQWHFSQYYIAYPTYEVTKRYFETSIFGDTWDKAGRYYDAEDVTSTLYASSETYKRYVKITFGSDYEYLESYNYMTWDSIQYAIPSTSRDTVYRVTCTGMGYTEVMQKVTALAESIIDRYYLYNRFDYADTVGYTSGSSTATPITLGSRDAVINFLAERLLYAEKFDMPYLGVRYIFGGYCLPSDTEDIDMLFYAGWREPYGYYGIGDQYQLHAITGLEAPKFRFYRAEGIAPNTFTFSAIEFDRTFAIYKLTLKEQYEMTWPTVSLKSTLEAPYTESYKMYSFYNSFSFSDMLTSIFEFNGIFGKRNRDGSIEPYTLTTTSQEDLTQSEVDELWWDESTVEPVGKVSVKYLDQDTQEEASAIIQIGEGTSQYNMEDNYFLTKFATDLDSVTTLLTGKFAENTAALTWTPTDATVRGLPYLEAGDYLTADTGATDIAEVGFPMLTRDMSGIQSLMDDITSAAGDIIEVTYASEEEEET